MRRTAVDLPLPGRDRKNTEGLLISLARWNHEITSQHSVAPVIRLRPMGTPTIGEPVPAAKGHSPHTWFVVARHSPGAWR